jgi:hypothetical protein
MKLPLIKPKFTITHEAQTQIGYACKLTAVLIKYKKPYSLHYDRPTTEAAAITDKDCIYYR